MPGSPLTRVAGRLTSYLPHQLVPVPVYGADIWLLVYIDSELGQAFVHEQHLIEKFTTLFSDDDTFLDIGSNIGLYSLIAAKHGVSSHAIDPTPEVIKRVRHNAELNGVADRVVAYQYAIWNTNDTMSFSLKDTPQTNALSTVQDTGASREIDVPTITLTDFCHQEDIIPDVVKIDVEHAGHGVLKGGMDVLAQNQPSIVMEIHDDSEETAFYKVVEELDYDCEKVTDGHWFATPK